MKQWKAFFSKTALLPNTTTVDDVVNIIAPFVLRLSALLATGALSREHGSAKDRGRSNYAAASSTSAVPKFIHVGRNSC